MKLLMLQACQTKNPPKKVALKSYWAQRVIGFAGFSPTGFRSPVPEKRFKLWGEGAGVYYSLQSLDAACVCVCACVHIRTCTLGGGAEGRALEWKGVWPHIRSANQSGSAAQQLRYEPSERSRGSRTHSLCRPNYVDRLGPSQSSSWYN